MFKQQTHRNPGGLKKKGPGHKKRRGGKELGIRVLQRKWRFRESPRAKKKRGRERVGSKKSPVKLRPMGIHRKKKKISRVPSQ